MELMSDTFRSFMTELIEEVKQGKQKIIVTVPLVNRRGDKIIEDLKRLKNCHLIEVTKKTRDGIHDKFLEECLKLK